MSSPLLRPGSKQLNVLSTPTDPGSGWICTRLSLGSGDSFVARFERSKSSDWVEVQVVPRDAPGKKFQTLDHCAVRYRGDLGTATSELRDQVLGLVAGVAGTIDSRLAASPGSGIAEALGQRREPGRVVFGRDVLRQLLSPIVVPDVPIVDGWTLADVYPSSYAAESAHSTLELVVEFRRATDSRRALLVVSRRDDDKPTFARTANFSLSYLSLAGGADDETAALRAWVALALELADHEALEVTFPDVSADVGPALLPSAGAQEERPPPAEWLNLAISSECSQNCNFCSIKEMAPATDGGNALFARLSADLVAARQRGVEGVRVNGYDPLAYSRIVELLEHATGLGYRRAHVFSPATLLADRDFCSKVVGALPGERRFFVPLYAVAPSVHDAVVDRPGAHALVLRALEHLIDLAGAPSVAILSVATRQNLAELPALAEWAAAKGLSFSAHMPYPSAESATDKYFECVPRQSDVAAAFAAEFARGAQMHRFPVLGTAPCVAFRAMTKRGVEAKRWLDVPERRPLLPGTEYKERRFEHGAGKRESAAFVSAAVECPHVADCALALACPGELLRAYVERYGLDELAPVSLAELVYGS